MINSVIRMLERTAAGVPDNIAISDKERSVTFREYRREARRIGSALLHVLKGQWNQPVAVLLPKSPETLFAFMGILYSGNYYVPLDYDTPTERLEKILGRLHHPFLITDEKGAARVRSIAGENRVLGIGVLRGDSSTEAEAAQAKTPHLPANREGCPADLQNTPAVEKSAAVDPLEQTYDRIIDTDPVYVIFTSGSTGEPKGVVVPHRAVIDFLEWWTERFSLTEETVFANQAPFHFDLSMPDIFTPLFTGGRIHLLDAGLFMNPLGLIREINRAGVNVLNWSPSAMMMLSYTRALEREHFQKLRLMMFIGEPMPVKHLNYWREHCEGTCFVNLYGPTETAYASTYYVIDREFAESDILPIGRACGNERVFLLSEEGNLVTGAGEIAEICITGSCLANGYFGMEHPAFSWMPGRPDYPERIYHTGDLGRYNAYGELECLGRMDSQIKHMGYRIELGEVESALSAVPAVRNACVLYNPQKNEITAFYEADPEVDRRYLLHALETVLPVYMRPGKFIRFDKMPLNANGKTDRAALRRDYLPQ